MARSTQRVTHTLVPHAHSTAGTGGDDAESERVNVPNFYVLPVHTAVMTVVDVHCVKKRPTHPTRYSYQSPQQALAVGLSVMPP